MFGKVLCFEENEHLLLAEDLLFFAEIEVEFLVLEGEGAAWRGQDVAIFEHLQYFFLLQDDSLAIIVDLDIVTVLNTHRVLRLMIVQSVLVKSHESLVHWGVLQIVVLNLLVEAYLILIFFDLLVVAFEFIEYLLRNHHILVSDAEQLHVFLDIAGTFVLLHHLINDVHYWIVELVALTQILLRQLLWDQCLLSKLYREDEELLYAFYLLLNQLNIEWIIVTSQHFNADILQKLNGLELFL